jgi:hypothetical protein
VIKARIQKKPNWAKNKREEEAGERKNKWKGRGLRSSTEDQGEVKSGLKSYKEDQEKRAQRWARRRNRSRKMIRAK